MRSYFPPPPFLGRFVRRTAATWIFFRVAAILGAAAMLELYSDLEGTARPTALPIGPYWLAALVGGVVVVLVLGDMARRSELLFLSNFGWSAYRLATGAFIVCGALEAALRVAVVW